MSIIKNYHLENVKVYRDDPYSVRCIKEHCFTNVAEGDFRGRHFVIGCNWFGVPVAYVEVKDEDNVEDKDGEDYVGRINFGEWRKDDDRRYFGWDYGHGYQWEPEYGMSSLYGLYKRPNWNPDNGHKYNLLEIFMEVAEYINDLNYRHVFEK